MSGAFLPNRFVTRLLAALCAMIALTAAALVVDAPRTALGQDEAACEVNDLGILDDGMVGLSAVGTWTTGDCDSRFRIDSDAHTYRFQHTEVTGSEST